MFFRNDKLWVGLIIGFIVPFVGYALLLTLVEQMEQMGFMSQEGFSTTFRTRTLTVVAICLNIIPLNLYNRYQMLESMRGIVFPTAIYVIAWIIYFGPYIF